MAKKILVFICIVSLFVSCAKDKTTSACPYTAPTTVAPASEVAGLKTYIDTYHAGAILHPNGFYYEIISAGTGATANVCSTITVTYTGKFTNNVTFDQNTTGFTNVLGDRLIAGWQLGIPLIKAGGSINLYIPPSLAYGSAAYGSIPANSFLVFNIQLLAVQ